MRDPPLCFWSKSVELHENKRAAFFVNAKKHKRVRKNVKTKEMSAVERGQ